MLAELMQFVIENNVDRSMVSTASSKLLQLVIQKGRFDLFPVFESSVFNVDNMLLMIDCSNSEDDVMLMNNVRYSYEERKKILNALVNKKYYNLASMFSSEINNSEELLDIFLSEIGNYNYSASTLRSFMEKHSFKVISSLVNAKRFDLVALMLTKNISNTDCLDLIKDYAADITPYIEFFNIDVSVNLLFDNPMLFEALFINNCPSILKCIIYFGSKNVKEHINNSDLLKDKVISYVPNASEEYLNSLSSLDFTYSSEIVLNAVLRKGITKNLSYYKASAWSEENQLLVIDLMRDNKINRSEIANNPFINYYLGYGKDYYVYYDDDVLNIRNISSIDNVKRTLANSSATIAAMPLISKLYEFLLNNNSNNICRLVVALLNNDMNNVGKLFTDEGPTEYLYGYLKYDMDYILNNYKTLIDENKNNRNYLTYVGMVCSYPHLNALLSYLFINERSIDKIISNNTISRYAIDLLMNSEGMKVLETFIDTDYELDLSDVEVALVRKINKIPTEKQKDKFLEYYMKRKETFTIDNINELYSIFSKVNESNSYELRKQADNIIDKIVDKDNPEEEFNKLEYTLTSGSVPEFFKRFVIYKILYGDIEIKDDHNITSPVLRDAKSRSEADKIIFTDLLRISVASCSQDILNYIGSLTKGNSLFNNIVLGRKTEITEDDKELLHDYRIKLEYISDYLVNLQYEKVDDDLETIINIEKAYCELKHIPYFSGYISLPFSISIYSDYIKLFPNEVMLKGYAFKNSIIRNLEEELRYSRNIPFEIKKGDFIKGIESKFLDNILGFGMLSKEFLGEDSQTDGTHLDSDMSLIEKDYGSIGELMASDLTGTSWGDMSLILSRSYMEKMNDIVITKDENGIREYNSEDINKTEIFSHHGNHYCARTGMPTSYIKGIVASKNFNRARFLVSRGENYIPVFDRLGKLVYTFEDYQEDKIKMNGLSRYGRKIYDISPNLLTEDTEAILSNLVDDNRETEIKRNAIFNKLRPIFEEYFSHIKHKVSSSVSNGTIEIFDTGSTGRNTNVPGDGDFDFIMRIDRSFLNSPKYKEFITKIYQAFGYPLGDEKVIRLKNVNLDGIDIPLQVEITVIDKNSKMDYSTEMCINDRLNTIRELYPESYDFVKANIIFAKKFFKDAGIYKPYENGFGGVGVENFILQHGGSFIDAIEDFINCANKSKNVGEFKEKFHIYDYGKNHFAFTEGNYKNVSFPYDDYVSSLNDSSYNKMKNLFEEYLLKNKKELLV